MAHPILKRWRSILRSTYHEYLDDHVSIVASGVAFRVAIAIFPAIALLVWVGTQVLGGEGVAALTKMLAGAVPQNSREIIVHAIHASTQHNPADRHGEYRYLGAAAPVAGLIFMIYSANSGMQALFNALNVIYDTEERRGFLRFTAITLLFTVGTLVTIAALTTIVMATPALLGGLGLGPDAALGLRWLRWPVLIVSMAFGLALLYRFAPHRKAEAWPLVTFGGILAALLIVLCTVLFSWFTTLFANLAVTYGSLSAVVAFMLWLWASFWIVLTCAELDSCIEAETGFYRGKRSPRP